MMVFRLIAFGRSSRGTRLGTSDWRAGRSKAPTAGAERGERVDRPHGRVSRCKASHCETDGNHRGAALRQQHQLASIHASATTPLIIEKTMIGTTLTSPTAPSASPLRSGGTSSDTCHSSAAFCMNVPMNDSSRPIQIRRKLRWRSAESARG